ncbi:MAG: hypothetical protein CMF31_07960 [Kordiimonas sp.]|nr:hypothetical protein [Kordiimonas sp.]|tara:strand:+ start:183 stop:1088 length:906 start_codon:yes stop_codon:yes gene_type:complete
MRAIISFLCVVAATTLFAQAGEKYAPGTSFKDCEKCPEMMVLPAGEFTYGRERARDFTDDEYGQIERQLYAMTTKKVSIAAFAIGRYEVTYGEYMHCVAAGGCNENPMEDFGADPRLPAVGITWPMAQNYVRWLNEKTGRVYRLPSSSEWEYAAKAGTHTSYWWGDKMEDGRVLCRGCFQNPQGMPGYNTTTGRFERPYHVGFFPSNPFGLHDMLGGVMEWVQDCVVTSVQNIPSGGSPYEPNKECVLFRDGRYAQFNGMRMIRGGDFDAQLSFMVVSDIKINATDFRKNFLGFRVVAEIQ